MTETIRPLEIEGTILQALTDFRTQVQDLNVVTDLKVCTKKYEMTRIFSVLSHDFILEETREQRYKDLENASSELERKLDAIMSVRISYLNPSKISEFEENCRMRGISVETLSILPQSPLNQQSTNAPEI